MSISFQGVTVKHGNFNALTEINVEILTTPGVTGLIGTNGAGKTTLIETTLGLRPIFAGKIFYDGAKISYCQDTPEFEAHLKASEIIESSLLQAGLRSDDLLVKEALHEVGLTDSSGRYANTFSRGMKQRLGLASCLVLSPDVLFLDEPTSALDPFGRQNLLHLISSLSSRMRIVVSTHLLEDVEKIADDIIIIDSGKVPFFGSKRSLLAKQSDYWEVQFESNKDFSDTHEILSGKNVNVEFNSESKLNMQISIKDVPKLLYTLAEGRYEKVSSIRTSNTQIYAAFEDILRGDSNKNFNKN